MPDQPSFKLIQMYCDGELTPEQTAELENHLQANPQHRVVLQQQQAIDGKLKASVSRCMCDCACAPVQLRQAIERSFSAGPAEAGGRSSNDSSRPVLARIFTGPQRANLFAVAATLALVVGAVLFGIYGRTIDDVRPIQTADVVGQSALFASSEHDEHSAQTRQVDLSNQARDIAQAEAELTKHLGVPVEVFDLNEVGYEFIGAWQSGLPLAARSAHLMYRSTKPGPRKPMVSLFVVPYRECTGVCQELKAGKWKCAKEKSARECSHSVLYSTDQTLIYFLVCCDENDLQRLTEHITALPASSGR